MLYRSRDMAHDECNYFSFWAIFCPFNPLKAQKIKIKKKKKMKKSLELSSSYTCVPKIMIRWCMVPEIWCVTDGQTDLQKNFYFSLATFWFWSIKIWYLKLSIQAQILELFSRINFNFRSFFKDLKFLKKHLWKFTKNVLWNQTFSSLFIAISSSFAYKEMMQTLRNFKN